MTDMMRTYNRAKENGVEPIIDGNKITWVTLNGEFQVISFFNNKGEYVDSITLKIK